MKRFCLLFLIFLSFLFQGCSVKQEDSTLLKVGKYTLNTPLYVVIAVGGVATLATNLAVAPIAAPIKGIFKGFASIDDDANKESQIEPPVIDAKVDTAYTDLYFGD